MKTVKLNGKEYPYKFTISACKKFKEKFGADITQAGTDPEALALVIFYGIEAGCKIEKKEFDLDIEYFYDLEMDEVLKISVEVLGGDSDPKEKPEALKEGP